MRDAGVALIASGLSIGVVALVLLHLLPSGLSPLRNPVGQYGITRFKAGYRAQTLAYGLAGVGAAIGIAALPRPSQLVVVLCCVFAASRAGISWFPMDAPGAEQPNVATPDVITVNWPCAPSSPWPSRQPTFPGRSATITSAGPSARWAVRWRQRRWFPWSPSPSAAAPARGASAWLSESST